MKLDDNDFELFGVAPRFAQDRAALDARWRALQAEVHPDRFAADGAAAQRVAVQWAVRVNEAYQRLKDPLRRAAYLCELAGQRIDAENNTAMPGAFLMQQMEWREALDEARGDSAALDDVRRTMNGEREELLAAIERAIDETRDHAQAAALVRQLMFIDRFASEIGHADEAIHAPRASA